jgi:hypothetical protein
MNSTLHQLNERTPLLLRSLRPQTKALVLHLFRRFMVGIDFTTCAILSTSGSALHQPIPKLFPNSRKPDHRPLSPVFGKPDSFPLTLRPPVFRKRSHCPLAAPVSDLPSGPPSLGLHPSASTAFGKPNYHPSQPSSSRPTSLRPPLFRKSVRRPSSPPSSSKPAPVSKPAHSALIPLDKPKRETLTPPSSSEPHGYLQISPAIQPLTPHSVASPSLGLRRAPFSNPSSKASTPSPSSPYDDNDITGIQNDIPAVSGLASTGLASYQRLFPKYNRCMSEKTRPKRG